MAIFVRTLTWPVISLLVTGTIHFTLEAIRPDLRNTFVPPVLAPILLTYGAWVGYRAIGAGGTYLHAIAAAVVLGFLPVVLDIVGFGLILGRGTDAGVTAGVFGMAVIVFGSLIGSGFALSGLPVTEPSSEQVRVAAAVAVADTTPEAVRPSFPG